MLCFLVRATHPAAALSAVQRPSSVEFLQIEENSQSDLVLSSLVLCIVGHIRCFERKVCFVKLGCWNLTLKCIQLTGN